MTPPLPELRHDGAAESIVIAMAVSGSSAAFAELMRRRHHGVRRFMRQLCRNPDLGDDLSQQVFLRLWRSLGKLRSVEAFNGWLKQIMVSVWIDETRRRKTTVEPSAELIESVEPRRDSAQGLASDLEWALSMLEPRTRLCVLLAYGEGHTHAEIAGLLDIPLGTAKSLIVRGGAKLRAHLDDYAVKETRDGTAHG